MFKRELQSSESGSGAIRLVSALSLVRGDVTVVQENAFSNLAKSSK